MQIQINDKENYNIEVPEKLSSTEFRELLSRLTTISRIMSKDIFSVMNEVDNKEVKERKKYTYKSSESKIRATRNKSSTRIWCNTKDKSILLLKLHYHGNKEIKLELARRLNYDWNDICKALNGLKNRFDITPEEVGMRNYPGKYGQNSVSELRFPNYQFNLNVDEIYNKLMEEKNGTGNTAEEKEKEKEANDFIVD